MKMVLSTCPCQIAQTIAGKIVKSKLAACASIIPLVKSTYWWKGVMHTDDEALIIMKTADRLAPALCTKIKSLHPYEVPEIVVLAVEGGHRPYLDWVEASVRRAAGRKAGKK